MHRGFISGGDANSLGRNSDYYLYTKKWYMMISPYSYDNSAEFKIMFIGSNGDINGFSISSWLALGYGGVQFTELCCYLESAEAGLKN